MTGKRGPRISPEIRELIMKEALDSNEKRTGLASRLEATIEAKGLPSPTVETMEKLISKIRNDRDSEDRPWSLVALAQYDIQPEVLPVVMEVWAKALEQDNPLTIRQVKWIARLYYLLKHKGTDFLTEEARKYALREKMYKRPKAYPEKPGDAWQVWFGDALLYSMLTSSNDNDGDDGPFHKCMTSIKWVSTMDIGELKSRLKHRQKEVTNGTSKAAD